MEKMDKLDKVLAVGHPMTQSDVQQYRSLRNRIITAFGKKRYADMDDFEERVFIEVYRKLLENLCADVKKSAGITGSLVPEGNGYIEKLVKIFGDEYRPHYDALMKEREEEIVSIVHRKNAIREARDAAYEKIKVLEREKLEISKPLLERLKIMGDACERAEAEAKHFKELYGKLKGASA